MKKQLLSMMTCMALLAAGCGDTNKPGENTGGGGTGNDNEDPVPDLRHIVRVDVTETDGEVTEQENYRFAYDLRNRLTEMTHEYAGKEETDGERITLDYTEWPTVRYAIQGYEQGYPFKDEMMARMDEEHHRLKELDWNRWVTQGNDEVQILVTSDYTYNENNSLVSVTERNNPTSAMRIWYDGNMVGIQAGELGAEYATYGYKYLEDGRQAERTEFALNWLLYRTEFFNCLCGSSSYGKIFPMADLMGNWSHELYLETLRTDYHAGDNRLYTYDYTFDTDGYPTRVVCTEVDPDDGRSPLRVYTYTITYNRPA